MISAVIGLCFTVGIALHFGGGESFFGFSLRLFASGLLLVLVGVERVFHLTTPACFLVWWSLLTSPMNSVWRFLVCARAATVRI